MASSTKRLNGPRCKALTKVGKPCEALAGSDGLCSAHRDPNRMRELGRKGGKGRRGPKPERVNEGLREYLKREVPPATIWKALQAAMEGQNESARVSASRVLMDALAEPQERGEGCPRCAEMRAALPEAAERFSRLIEDRIARVRKQRLADPLSALEELAAELSAEAAQNHPDLIVGDVSAERAEAIFQHLSEVGLLVPGHKVEERAEQLAQERLQALKAEHGLAGL